MKKEYIETEEGQEQTEGVVQEVEAKVETPDDVREQIKLLLKSKQYKGRHFGGGADKEIGRQDIISTGSFWLDYVLGGGYRGGSWARFSGEPESGKTSQGLTWAANWQKRYPKDGFVFIFNAEGRISRELLERVGVDLSPERFFMLRTNDAETVWGMQQDMIMNNPGKRRYYFLIDAIDACEREEDKEKHFNQAQRVMGGATIISLAGKRLSLLYSVEGHFLYVSNQLRATMATTPGAAKSSPSGGNAIKFYSSLIGLMKKPWTDTYIYKDPSVKKQEVEIDGVKTSNVLGMFSEIRLDKTPNEKTGQTVSIPIKFGTGIWKAYEAMQICVNWGKYTRASSASSYVIDPEFEIELKDNNIPFDPKPRTDKVIRDAFDTNPQLTDFVISKFRKMIFNT